MDVPMALIMKNREEAFLLRSGPAYALFLACIVWVGTQGEEIVSLNESWIPLGLFPDILDDLALKKSSQDILKGKYPLLPYHARSVMDIIRGAVEPISSGIPPGRKIGSIWPPATS